MLFNTLDLLVQMCSRYTRYSTCGTSYCWATPRSLCTQGWQSYTNSETRCSPPGSTSASSSSLTCQVQYTSPVESLSVVVSINKKNLLREHRTMHVNGQISKLKFSIYSQHPELFETQPTIYPFFIFIYLNRSSPALQCVS